MNKTLTFDFSVNRENNTVTIEREYEANRRFVWDAYTKSEVLDKWWAPKPWKTRTKTMDFREGGNWIYAMEGPKGEVQWSRSDFKDIHFQKKFTGVDAFADADGKVNKNMPHSKWEVTFTDKGQNTLVETRISFDDSASLDELLKMGFKEGMTSAMENLDEVLAKLKK
jgi:uncharacterized protein YndB with AHSA1/START domain